MLQANCIMMSIVTLKLDSLTQNLTQHDCCEELCIKFIISQLFLDSRIQQTDSYFNHIKNVTSRVSDLEGKLQNKNGKPTRQSHTAHIL